VVSQHDEDDGPEPVAPRERTVSPDLGLDRRARWARTLTTSAVAVLALVLLVVDPLATPPGAGASADQAHHAASAPGVAAVAAPVAPGATDPAAGLADPHPAQVVGELPGIQGWLKSRESLQIELINAAVAVLKLDAASTRPGNPSCVRLVKVTAALQVFAAAPSAQLDQLTRAGLAPLIRGAGQCVTGQVAAAITSVKAGLAERAAATDSVDELLTGH
jgi:hypothetical protein